MNRASSSSAEILICPATHDMQATYGCMTVWYLDQNASQDIVCRGVVKTATSFSATATQTSNGSPGWQSFQFSLSNGTSYFAPGLRCDTNTNLGVGLYDWNSPASCL
jgi:hypothetical protein